MKRIIVIGAGVGGLVAAIRLAHAGYAVTVVEQGNRVGGKLNRWEPDVPGAGRFRFDTGPHVLTMPWAIRELFADVGERMDDYLDLIRVDPICRYHFADGSRFDADADPDTAAKRIATQFPGEEQGFRDLLAYAHRIHDTTVDPFLRQDFGTAVRGIPSPAQWRQLGDFLSLKPWQTIHKRVGDFVQHPQLRQMFDLFALYNGSSPYRASAIYTIIAWVQWGDGTFYLRGGLYQYAEVLLQLAEKHGVTVLLNTRAKQVQIDNGQVTGVDVEPGIEAQPCRCLPAEAVVCNSDPLSTYANLIPAAYRPRVYQDKGLARMQPSTSAFVLLLGVRGRHDEPPFAHMRHFNSFLPADGAAEFQSLFEQNPPRPADDPVIGVTCQSVTEPDCAPPNHTNLFVMTSPPPLGTGVADEFVWDEANTKQYRDRVLSLLETRGGMAGLRERIVCEQIWTPETFAARYGAWRGSLYGLSSNNWRSGFLRPPNRAKGVRGLYFTGGGTHPGGGLPLVTLGGKIVADAVQEDTS